MSGAQDDLADWLARSILREAREGEAEALVGYVDDEDEPLTYAAAKEPVWIRRMGVQYVQGVARALSRTALLRASDYTMRAEQRTIKALGAIAAGRGNAREVASAVYAAIGVPASKQDDPKLKAAMNSLALEFRAMLGGARAAGAVLTARARKAGLRYVSMDDDRTRKNHCAMHDFVAHSEDPVWARMAPPAGFNCRCVLRLVPRKELVRRGLAKADGTIARYRQVPRGGGWDLGWTGGAALGALLDAPPRSR